MFKNLHRTSSATQRYSRSPLRESSDPFTRTNGGRNGELTSRHRQDQHRAASPSRTSTNSSRSRLTDALLSATPKQYVAATETPFLRLAGQGKLSKHTLSRWLSQDRLYAETYITFITSLIARVTLPYAFVSDRSASLRWRIINILTGAFQNIHTELSFFTETAQKYGLQLDLPYDDTAKDFGPNRVTEQYLTLFRSYHLDPSQTLLEGLIVLWATEKCYLQAWTYASKFMASTVRESSDDLDGGALREKFIPNWSSDEFVQFVQDIADITDDLADQEGAMRKVEVYKALWSHVLEIEKDFWPDVDGQ
ncbi:hypothetical protein H2198_005922 [Neophaeococcomyces mojaviensis]|uniref:Uncharacterized protein n=1 Tax=Neophaeococcomyces mojaviensis TaxID=3383035 RepID=A0ACC3A4P2_9EURO|nr:hypothetical protein H2198_005922 [Knufia sp. JES_112]